MHRPSLHGRTRKSILAAAVTACLLAPLTPTSAEAQVLVPVRVPQGAPLAPGLDGTNVTLPPMVSGLVAADPATNRIFVAGINGTAALTPRGALISMDTTLNDVTTILAAAGAIWILRADEPTVTRLDPVSLTSQTWTKSGGGALSGLAYAGGAIWTTRRMVSSPTRLLRLDPAAGTWSTTITDLWSGVALGSAPFAPDTLVLGSGPTTYGHYIEVWDASGTIPVLGPKVGELPGYLLGLAISPDGTHVVATVLEGDPLVALYDLSDLAPAPHPAEPTAQHAVTSSAVAGGTVATLVQRSESHVDGLADVVIYRYGSTVPSIAAKVLNPAVEYLDRGGITMSGDGRTVLITSYSPSETRGHLHFLPIDPTIRSVSSTVLGTRGGAVVRVTGTSLGNVTTAHLGAATSPATATTPTAASFTAPPLAAGSYPFSLTVGAGTASGPSFRAAALGPFRAGTTFVDRQFADIVGRHPTATERSTWANRLGTGTTPGALPAGLVTSPSLGRYRAPMIRMYRAIYLQTPSLPTLTYWADRYRSGTKLSAIADYFAVSRYGSMPNRNFVDQVFRAVLGRPATSAELTLWSNQMHGGMTRGEVLVFFSESRENITRQTPVVRVSELYLGMLRRPPTAAETTSGLALVGGLPVLAAQILTSGPYASRYPNG